MTFYPPPPQDPVDPVHPPAGYPTMPPPNGPYPQPYQYGQPGPVPPQPYYPYAYPPPQASNGMAVAGFVCGLVGLFFCNMLLGPLAIIFASVGRSRANEGASGSGMAVAGIVLGIVDVVIFLVLLTVMLNTHHGFFFV